MPDGRLVQPLAVVRHAQELPAVGDHVALELDDEEGIVTKIGGGWISVKLDDGTVEKFRSTELRY